MDEIFDMVGHALHENDIVVAHGYSGPWLGKIVEIRALPVGEPIIYVLELGISLPRVTRHHQDNLIRITVTPEILLYSLKGQ